MKAVQHAKAMYRPRYHITSPTGKDYLPFDPNGAIFWRDRYHLGFIYQENTVHHWGHISSADMVNWTLHPPMLSPLEGDPEEGIFSGNAFVDKRGRVVLHYHGYRAGNCIAVNVDDDLIHFQKLVGNPVMKDPGWDPYGWLEGDIYYCISGGMANRRANWPLDSPVRQLASLYKSLDDEQSKWTLVGKFMANELPDVEEDEDISAPDLFELGGRRVLLCISHKRGARYYLGRFEDEQFHAEQHCRMNWPGGACFAPETLLDGKDRRIFWAWALGTPTSMTLPRVLSMAEDGVMQIEPAPELEILRGRHQRFDSATIEPGIELIVDGIEGDCLELSVILDPQQATQCGLKVRCAPDGQEETAISYDAGRRLLRIDFHKASLDPTRIFRSFFFTPEDIDEVEAAMDAGVERQLRPSSANPQVTAQEAPFSLRPGEHLNLRVFLDKSMLEVFANGRQCLTQRIYPTLPDSLGVRLFSLGDEATCHGVDSWDMTPITLT